jgi:hypothetical protein
MQIADGATEVMSEDKESPRSDGKPLKKGFDLNIYLEPVTDVQTSIGKLYLFPLRASDIDSYKRISTDKPVARIREFLPFIASLSFNNTLKNKRVAITVEQVGQLSDEEVESLAEAYATSSKVGQARKGRKGMEPLAQSQGEPATSFLIRLLRKEIEEQESQLRKAWEQALGSTGSIFDQVRKSTLELEKTWKSFERLSMAKEVPPLETKPLEMNNHLAQYHARLAREREEDREIIRLTGQMTAQSAKTLQELAGAASTLLEALDQRDSESKRTTKIQLWIAVGTVIISAMLAGASFWQDKVNNSSNNQWQATLLSEVKGSNQRRSALTNEAKSLKEEVQRLQQQALKLDDQLRVAKDTKQVPATSTSGSKQGN